MSSFIDLIETFEIPALTSKIYSEKIDGLVNRFPRLNKSDEYRIVLPQKFPKTADDYVSMKFCVMGRFPVFGIYNKRDLQLIAVCVEKVLYAIDDCDLDPEFVPDLTVMNVYLGVRHSPLAVSQSLSYTKKTIYSAVSILSLGYTLDKKVEWTDAFVLLRGITTQAVRFSRMQSHVRTGFYLTPDGPHVPHPICLSLLPKWRDVSKSIREGKSTYSYNYYDYDNDKIRSAGVCAFSYANSVQLIDDGDRTKGKKFRRRNDDSNGQMDRSKMNSKYEKFTGQAAPALGASPNLGVDKTKSLELCGTSEAAYPGNSDVFRRTLAAASLGASQKLDVDKSKSIESSATSESANSGMSHVFRTTLAAPASGATHKVSPSMKDMCFDQFRMTKEEKDRNMAKGNQDELLQLACEPISEPIGATCVYPLQGIMTRMGDQQSNTNAPHSSMSNVIRRTLGHEGFKRLQEGLFPNVLKVVSSARVPTKLKAAIILVAKGLPSKK
ncbi:hypothetical protein POM88_021157 [Heracleum sosnowskyi]|uniref:Uncharacterized protein n=1 Tax=Heracleum sosnowskyi TaxID=360622 RepID=A0AAD8ICP7_9APIA|nr:hypothetical protein POM88_021157 [Heracleum sosnowskyi]